MTNMLRIGIAFSMLLSTIFAAHIKVNRLRDNNYCYAEDDNPYVYFATIAHYDFIKGADLNQHIIPNCKPVQFWGFNRHGTRLPNYSIIKELQYLDNVKEQVLNNYRNQVPNSGGLCEKDLDLLNNWKWNKSITVNMTKMLTSQGWDELRQMASRYKKWYPELLNVPYSAKDFEFRWTSTERTESSFRAYAEGLFGENHMKAEGHVDDTLLKAYKTCKKWIDTVDNNHAIYNEVFKFYDSIEFQNMLSEVTARLGLEAKINETLLYTIYDMCRFDQAWKPNAKSPWCSAFTKKHLEILEYAEDLSYYYNNGYVYELSSKVGCLPLKDLMEKFETAVNGSQHQPKVSVYFTHSAALQLLITSMSINKDELPLTADNMDHLKDRLWRISLMVSLAANFNAVLYKCNEGDKNRVIFFLNEKRVHYPGCPEGICSWEFLKNNLMSTVHNCNLDFCDE